MLEGRNLGYNCDNNSNNSPSESNGREISSSSQRPSVYIDVETGYDTISTLNSVPKIFLEAPPVPPRTSTQDIMLDKSNITMKLAPPRWGSKGHNVYKTAFNCKQERGENVIMEAKLQNLQLYKRCATARHYVSTSQSYMKRKLNNYHAQSTKMISLSAEIKATNQNITEMRLTVRSLNGKVRAKNLKIDA